MQKLPYGTVLRSTDSTDYMVVSSQLGLRDKHRQYKLRCSDGETRILSRSKVEQLITAGKVTVHCP